MTLKVDAIVIGAGVIGLACAARLAGRGLQTVLLDKESKIGQGVSSRSSEVVHAGLYYPAGSLKARLCRQGARLLYRYCEQRSVTCRRVGKLVVAVEESQIAPLEAICARALENGCNIGLLSGCEANQLEPELRCSAALISPDTGIVDSHGLMDALLADFESSGGMFVRRSAVRGGELLAKGAQLELDDGEGTRVSAGHVVNAAGIDAPVVAAMLGGFPASHVPLRCFAKGSYFSLSGKNPFSRLIYPVPETGGLGVHLTIDLQGQARFGPDVEWVARPEYNVPLYKRRQFYEAIRRYWPNCSEERLSPGYAGIRPKLGTPQAFAEDFVIQSGETHGVAGLVNLFGIESPGLTSCLAIADEVVARLGLDELKEAE